MKDYQQLREERLQSLSAAEKREYDEAYAEAGLALEVAELIYNARTRSGLTQADLAHRVGQKQPYISALENGARQPSLPMLAKLIAATGSKLQLSLG